MKLIKLKEIAEWAKAQPPDRPIDMDFFDKSQGENKDCGCLMIEYAKDHNIQGVYLCDNDSWMTKDRQHLAQLSPSPDGFGPVYIWDIFKEVLPYDRPKTFGEIVELFDDEYKS